MEQRYGYAGTVRTSIPHDSDYALDLAKDEAADGNLDTCTCCCMDCIEGRHCGETNEHPAGMDRALPEDLPEWLRDFTDRERDEIKFAQVYAIQFAHGTVGHSRLILIAKLADKLNTSELMRTDPQALEPDLQAIEVPKKVIEIHSLMEKLQGQ